MKEKTWYAVQPEHCGGWWVVSSDEDGENTIDESHDGGFEQATAEYIAKCLNFCRDHMPESLGEHDCEHVRNSSKKEETLEVLDAQHLDWFLQHPDAEYDEDSEGGYITAYLSSEDDATNGVSGLFLGRGNTRIACVDAFLCGRVQRID